MSNIKLPSVNFVCDTTNTCKRAMTFKFLNFHLLNLAKPEKYLKKEFTSRRFNYAYEKEESRKYIILCHCVVLFTLR